MTNNQMLNAKCQTQKGITLIALIITVIVLLILAGTAISIAINGGDIFNKASDARTSWNTAVAKEESEINNVMTMLNTLTDGNGGGGSTLPEGWDSTKVASTVTGTITVDGEQVSVTAPIPTGFTASDISTEDEISEGLVIYQGTGQVSTDANAITERNQFVWIPVTDINSMVMCTQNAENSICNIILEDGELKCTTHTTTGATNMCGRLYGVSSNYTTVDGKYIYSTSMNFALNTQTYSVNSDHREPAIVTGNNEGIVTSYDGASNNYHGLANASAFLTQLQNDFYAMAKSVALYKGFYIGRYEAGYDSTTYTSKKGQTVMNANTTANVGANMWYGLYNHLRTTMGTLNSQMIWGSQYDQAIKFIKQNKGAEELDPEIGHTDIGLKTTKGVSGAEGVNDIMKNIYDLEGNCIEWTAQANSTGYRDVRGGYYNGVRYSSFYPASHRDSRLPTSNSDNDGSRPGLYL